MREAAVVPNEAAVATQRYVEFPVLSAPTTPPSKKPKARRNATQPLGPLAIPVVEESDSDQELLLASPQMQSSAAYGKGGGRGGTEVRSGADPYEICSPVTHVPQPLSAIQPAQAAPAEAAPVGTSTSGEQARQGGDDIAPLVM